MDDKISKSITNHHQQHTYHWTFSSIRTKPLPKLVSKRREEEKYNFQHNEFHSIDGNAVNQKTFE